MGLFFSLHKYSGQVGLQINYASWQKANPFYWYEYQLQKLTQTLVNLLGLNRVFVNHALLNCQWDYKRCQGLKMLSTLQILRGSWQAERHFKKMWTYVLKKLVIKSQHTVASLWFTVYCDAVPHYCQRVIISLIRAVLSSWCLALTALSWLSSKQLSFIPSLRGDCVGGGLNKQKARR